MIEVSELHSWDVGCGEAKDIQDRLKERLVLSPSAKEITLVAGADVSFSVGDKEMLLGAVVVLRFPELSVVEEVVSSRRVRFPYVPGYLSFREAPPLIETFRRLTCRPDLVIFDGQGIAHPRGLGLASHMGLTLGTPSIGCAKSRLVGEHDEPGEKVGSMTPLKFKGREIGAVVRTRENVKPVYVSPGHLIDTAGSVDMILKCVTRFRLPEPIRMAHRLTRRARLGEVGV